MATALLTTKLKIFWNVHYTVLCSNKHQFQSDFHTVSTIYDQFKQYLGLPTGIWSSYVNKALCATCTYMYILDCITFENGDVMSLELEALGTLMLVLVIIYQFCSQFHLVLQHVDYQWHQQQHHHHL